VQWDVTREVKMRFDREGVSIPFPQRDVHLYPTEPAAPTTASPSIGSGGTPPSGQTEPENDED
jgi:small-conductance mechanosensitive channel